jgi:hypothetical protein
MFGNLSFGVLLFCQIGLSIVGCIARKRWLHERHGGAVRAVSALLIPAFLTALIIYLCYGTGLLTTGTIMAATTIGMWIVALLFAGAITSFVCSQK